MKSQRIAIAGAGPAGSSLAIRLARSGFYVTLIERERFPRHKLCGEFISPECLRHFGKLGVLDEMLAAGGERVLETRFYDRRGRSFSLPSTLLDHVGFALSLSRSSMDDILLSQARTAGVNVLDGTRVTGVSGDGPRIDRLDTVNGDGHPVSVEADIFVDATGRASVLSKMFERRSVSGTKKARQRPLAVGFKAHLRGSRAERGICEIFSFPGGYGGLTRVEDGVANLCFMMDARKAREFGGDADRIVREALRQNERAAHVLQGAETVRGWLAVSVSYYGRSRTPAADNLFTVGDSAAFIDPFTGSGMLMALESSALLASVLETGKSTASAAEMFRLEYGRTFAKRLRVCSALRRVAFMPVLPTLAIGFLNFSERSRGRLAAAVRSRRDARPELR